MGYFIDEIAKESETPVKVSLSGNPNFIQFENNSDKEDKPVDISITVTGKGVEFESDNDFPPTIKPVIVTGFKLVESKTKKDYYLKTTFSPDMVKDYTYYIGPCNEFGVTKWELWQIAESLFNTLLKIDFIADNFDVTLPPVTVKNGKLERGTKICIKSRGSGSDFAFTIVPDHEAIYKEYISVDGNPEDTENNDSISTGSNPVEILLDLYKDTGVFLGEEDMPDTENMGTYVTTLSKSYHGVPVWFNLNVLDNNKPSAGFLDTDREYKWFDAGTMGDFRFIAKRLINDTEKYENSPFYYSNIFYTVAGYDRTLEKNDLSAHIYNTLDNNIISPLTTQPVLTHVKGQSQYFNFILSDSFHGKEEPYYQIGLRYKLYSSSGHFIAETTGGMEDRNNFHMVNTIKLDIDNIIDAHKNAGSVEVCLFRSDKEQPISSSLRFTILPECLYKVNDFVFLNRLGGWSSFNFPGTEKTDFKAKSTTIYQTHTPGKKVNSEIESVYGKTVTESFSAATMPLTREICDWLKELGASKFVYELSSGRYVVVDELNIRHDTKDELFRVEMKYRYSDSFNAIIE